MKLYHHQRSSEIAPFITLKYKSDYDVNKLEQSLAKIASKNIGSQLLGELKSNSTNGRKLEIIIDVNEESGAMPMLTDSQLKKYKINYSEDEMNSDEYSEDIKKNTDKAIDLSKRKPFWKGSSGVSVILRVNPYQYLNIDPQGRMFRDFDSGKSFITLSHELIHALHYMKGDHRGEEEENYTVGLNKFKNEKFTENSIRKEHDIRLREKYYLDEVDAFKYNIR